MTKKETASEAKKATFTTPQFIVFIIVLFVSLVASRFVFSLLQPTLSPDGVLLQSSSGWVGFAFVGVVSLASAFLPQLAAGIPKAIKDKLDAIALEKEAKEAKRTAAVVKSVLEEMEKDKAKPKA